MDIGPVPQINGVPESEKITSIETPVDYTPDWMKEDDSPEAPEEIESLGTETTLPATPPVESIYTAPTTKPESVNPKLEEVPTEAVGEIAGEQELLGSGITSIADAKEKEVRDNIIAAHGNQ